MAQDLKSEIEYVKSLAEAGDSKNLAISHFILFGGLCFFLINFALAILIALERYHVINTPLAININPIVRAITLLFIIFLPIVLIFGYIKLSKIKLSLAEKHSISNKAANSVWVAIFVASTFYILAQIFLMLIARRYETNVFRGAIESMEDLRRPIFFLLIGVGWWVTSSVSKFSMLKIASYFCFIMVPLAVYMRTIYSFGGPKYDQLIATGFNAFSILTLVIAPALYMVQKEKASG